MDDDWIDKLATAMVLIAMIGLAAFPLAIVLAGIFGGWVTGHPG
jgi:hypothetical protein